MLTIKREIKVLMVLTEAARQKLNAELYSLQKRYELELEQLDFQAKKLLYEAQRKGRDAIAIVERRLSQEKTAREEKLAEIAVRLEHIASLADGSEIPYTTVQSDVEIRVGDCFDELMNGAEIVLVDGIVAEIRKGGKRGE
ncbi:YlqD family protein [Aneurinibacillus uraniidurans]|uniref:YlqD family protein n=1 Tax=Aneurinibacillus uraniidurans TaxID=2966586 RepID=UPI00234A73A7|nr:YlqD family protein [Aneurinibacillus sp. B1]WCN39067.1 YlqD family protein [Aneurinibacillus sp. B1]